MNHRVVFLCLITALAAVAAGPRTSALQPRKPNIVFILADDATSSRLTSIASRPSGQYTADLIAERSLRFIRDHRGEGVIRRWSRAA